MINVPKRSTYLTFGLTLLLQLIGSAGYAYVVGDYGSIASGNWSGAATWGIWNGSTWVATAFQPASGNDVYILSGKTVNLSPTGPYSCRNLTVEGPVTLPTTKLWSTNNATNIYITVYGTQIICDGRIGDGNTFDGVSFNIEGASCTISGTGIFDTSRIRKSTSTNGTTNLVFNMNVGLHFNTASSTMIYNATPSTFFNVTISAGYTVALIAAGGTGNVCMNSTGGSGGGGGAYTIYGTLLVQNSLVLINGAGAGAPTCAFTIKTGGYVRAASLNCGASGGSGHTLTIEDGGTLEINGTPTTFIGFSTTNNTYSLGLTSLVDYSAVGAQTVQHQFPLGYGHLRISGSLTKSLGGNTVVRSNLTITNASGSPRLDATVSNLNLSVGGNWSNYGQLGFTEQLGKVIFTNQYASTTLTTPGGEVFYNLQMSKAASQVMSMQSDVTITNELKFQVGIGGCLDLNANMLTITNPLSIAVVQGNPNGFVKSERMDNLSRVRWSIGATTGAHVFPFGTGSNVPSFAANYIPFTYNLTAGNAGDVTMATYHTPPDNLAWPVSPITVLNLNSTTSLSPDNRDATVDRFWEIDHAGSPTTSYTFTYLTSELPVSPFNILGAIQAQRYDDPVDIWQAPLAGQSSGALVSTYYANVNNVTKASAPWTLSALASPLPIELIDFHAEGGCGEIDVKWSTATEKDNDHFMLRRSADGEVFEDLVRVEGAGTSQQRLDYSFIDAAPHPFMNYYRLDQVDVDGTESQSAVIASRTLDCSDITATVYPNPATDQLSIVGLPVGKGLGVSIDLLDTQGRVLRNWRVADALNRLDIDHLGVAPGGYLLRIVTNDRSQTVRVIVR